MVVHVSVQNKKTNIILEIYYILNGKQTHNIVQYPILFHSALKIICQPFVGGML